jgi:hypothetical protein
VYACVVCVFEVVCCGILLILCVCVVFASIQNFEYYKNNEYKNKIH